jgi:hypothetical protein
VSSLAEAVPAGVIYPGTAILIVASGFAAENPEIDRVPG